MSRALRGLGAAVDVAAFCVFVAACSWWSGGGGVKTVTAAECIADHAIAGQDVVTIAQACAVPVGQVMISLIEAKDPKVAGTPAAREARQGRDDMAAVDGGW